MQTRKKVKTSDLDQQQDQKQIMGIQLQQSDMRDLRAVINKILEYQDEGLYDYHHQMHSLSTLPQQILDALPQLKQRPNRIINCVAQNAYFLRQMVGGRQVPFQSSITSGFYRYDITHIQDLLLKFVVQWTQQGLPQRAQYQLIKNLLAKFSSPTQKVLVAGSGLGRLPYQLAKLGRQIQAHEHRLDYFLGANFILNNCGQRMQIHPHIHNFCNHISEEGPYRLYKVPDVIPLLDNNLDITASLGDFSFVYQHMPNQWPCIVSCNYLDRVISAPWLMRAIKRALKKGGIWINYSSVPRNMSVEQVMGVIEGLQFTIIQQGDDWYIPYKDSQKMMCTQFKTFWFVARSSQK